MSEKKDDKKSELRVITQLSSMVGEVSSVVSTWKAHAKKIKIPRADMMLAEGIIKTE